MLRSISAVVFGYIAMMVMVMGSFTVSYLLMGADNAFKPGLYEPSVMWIVITTFLAVIAALVGGLVCSLIARPGSKAYIALSCVIMVLGLLGALPIFLNTMPDPGPRAGDVPMSEIWTKAKQPAWVAVMNPVIGVAGVVLVAKLRKPKAA
jgi:hypothetical protein